jgi:hypoxanthine phosphoribosyltransferase
LIRHLQALAFPLAANIIGECFQTPQMADGCKMQEDIQRILLDRPIIESRVKEMAGQIAAVYGQTEFVLMPLLTGSIIFVADLVRQLPVRMRIDVLAVSSYPGRAIASQGPRILYPTEFNVAGKHVLVIDDILDSGRTLKAVYDLLGQQGAASVRSCVLVRKQVAQAQQITADFIGFDIPDEFVVGYGLDYNNYYRNLPYIAILHPRIFSP